MTEILCRWLNSDLGISQPVDQKNFAEKFASGYLIGEVLKKYDLQEDFESFSQSRTADSKLNNFTRLEPTLHLLEVPFDTNTAHGVMQEQPGVATRLMYQLYIALHNKRQANLTGVAMETMRARAPVKLESLERGPYKERLKVLTPRQTDLNLDQLVEKFRERKRQHLDVEFRTRYEEEEKRREWQQDERLRELQKAADARKRQTELVARIKAATVEMPKTPPNKTLKAIVARRDAALKREASEMRRQIAEFENQLSRSLNMTQEDRDADEEVATYLQQQQLEKEKAKPELVQLIRPASNDEYISKIRKRLQEDATARQEREKRRRKVLVDQLKAHDAQEEARREEMLVNRLMRQSQQERRIATQLLQLRHEKAVICQNRIFREQQYEERRQRDFQEALDKEAELARLAKLEYIEQTKQDKELHDKIAQERAEAKYLKRYNICQDILLDLVDLSCKVGKYRELTEKQLPAKLMREWKMLFSTGQPLYEKPIEGQGEEPVESAEDQLVEKERQALLDEGDFLEYRNMVGEWQIPADCDIKGPQKSNAILGHILARIFNIVSPPTPPPAAPEIPPFPVKACFLGKAFTGKSTVASKLAEDHGLAVLNIDELVRDAVDAYKDGEVMDIPPPAPTEVEPVEGAGGDQPPAAAVATVESPSGQLSTPGDATVNTAASIPEARDSKEKVEDDKPDTAKEGGEATDKPPEAPSSEVKTVKKPPSPTKKKGPPKPEPTARAKLGKLASKFLRKGQPVKDELLIDIMVEAVKRTPEEHGWIMDGFPATLAQAKLLEKALSGYDANAKPSRSKLRQSRLAPDPNPPKEPPPPVSGIDLVLLFESPDELVLKRAAGRTYASQSREQYQQEFKPPPEGSCTGVGKQEKVSAVKDAAHDQEQIQHRLTGFQDAWKKLDKWFSGFGILRKVDVASEQQEAYTRVEEIMIEMREKIEKAKEEAEKQEEDLLKAATEGSTAGATSEVPTTTQPTEGMDSLATQQGDTQPSDGALSEAGKESTPAVAPGSPKGSRAGSAKRSGSAKGGSPKRGNSPKREKSPKSGKRDREKKREGSRSGSAKRSPSSGKGSPKRGKSGRKSPKREPTPEPEPEPEPPVPTGPPPPQPGSEDWVYVDEPIDEALALVLAPHWENTEATYVASSKHVFHNIRDERENIYHYFYKVRRDFEEYLRRPDSKQEFLAAWQQEYNEIAEDMRDDDETKSELHQRVQDLKEQLWEMSDNRKEDAEKERTSVMEEGWLEDRLGLLTNHYLTLMQGEVDRYQDTLRLLKDYYQGMEGKIPEEFDAGFVRIPLIDLSTVAERPSSAPVSAPASESVTRAVTPTTPSAKGKKGKEPPPEEAKEELEEEKPKIPLVPRRPTSTEGFFPSQTPAGKAEKGSKSRAGKKEKEKPAPVASQEEAQESPQPPTDPDEKLIFDAFQFGMMKITEITAAELAARDAEDEAEKLREAEKDKEKEKGAAKKPGKKRSKSKSPSGKRSPAGGKKSPSGKKSPVGKKSPKKGKKTATPTPPPTPPPATEDTPEEKAKKELRDRMKQEYLGAISHEEAGLKMRMELTKIHAIAVLQELKAKAEEVYKDMDDWLGARFQQEMASIDTLAEVLGEKIEKKEKIQPELVSLQDDFIVNKEVAVFRTPSPPPRPSPTEIAQPDAFTVDQMRLLHHQFMSSAPSGFISNKAFVDTLSDMTALTHGTEALPDNWMGLNLHQLEQLSTILSPDCEYVDWRTFMLQVAQPWPQPSQAQLLETLQGFKAVDTLNVGIVTREQFEQVRLWYTADPSPPEPNDPSKPLPFDRVTHVQKFLFDIFADQASQPPVVDYTNMLLYFSVDQDAMNGLFRALSIASAKHMPRPQLEDIESREKQLDQLNVMKEVVEVITGSEIRLQDKRVEPSLGPPEEGIPPSALQATVELKALVQVLHHGRPTLGDSHRFSVTSDPEDTFSQERLASVYRELGDNKLGPVPFFTLVDHPIIQDCLAMCHRYKTPDLRPVFAAATTTTTILVDNDATSVMS
ncbi:sperm flagellar protein 2-like isoform X2 [Acanthaster planci]|uniref:Sperm flagellar protein 2-like isoform X2 n=1 Tax=Acanthaster planci TaxID=133434 RepID=A0A8B7ZAG6_ACAPL|nr:sperm flagellar protein 2-like isoform X2 [Acanthaster planci]